MGKSKGKGKEANKRCAVKAFLRALELCLKGDSGICWLTCLSLSYPRIDASWIVIHQFLAYLWLKPASGPVNSPVFPGCPVPRKKTLRQKGKADFREQSGQQRNMGRL